MTKTIIHILGHSPPYNFFTTLSKDKIFLPNGKWFSFFWGNWHNLLAEKTLKHCSTYNIECWHIDNRVDKIYTKVFPSGIIQRIFPAIQWKIPKVAAGEYCFEMIPYLRHLLKNNKPILLHLHRSDNPIMMQVLSRLKLDKTPIITQDHEDELFLTHLKKTNNPLRYLYYWLGHKLQIKKVQNIDCYIIQTHNNREKWQNIYKGKIFMQTMGIDSDYWCYGDKIKAHLKLNIDSNKKIILSASNLSPKKAIIEAIKAFKDLPANIKKQTIFIIIGHGFPDYTNKIKKLIEKENLEKSVKILGRVDNETLRNYYQAADIFINNSKAEAGPVSVMKALMMNVPLITTEVGNVGELMRRENIPTLIPIGDIKQLTSAFYNILQNPTIPSTREIALKYYSWDRIIKNTLSIYDELFQQYYKL